MQYQLDLATAGLEDGPPAGGPLAQRHEALRKYTDAWNQLKWSKQIEVPMSRSGLWELFGGVLGQNTPKGGFTFTRLPSVLRGIEEKTWTVPKPGIELRDFTMDPGQDLLVLIEKPRWYVWPFRYVFGFHDLYLYRDGPTADRKHHLHLLSLQKSPGSTHPLAKGGADLSHIQNLRDVSISYTIQIAGDFIGLLISSDHVGGHEFLVWDWKCGQLKLVSVCWL